VRVLAHCPAGTEPGAGRKEEPWHLTQLAQTLPHLLNSVMAYLKPTCITGPSFNICELRLVLDVSLPFASRSGEGKLA
jgi:hypothetical protein